MNNPVEHGSSWVLLSFKKGTIVILKRYAQVLRSHSLLCD